MSRMLTAEQVREAVESNSWAETSSIREFNDSSWQAIADELNAMLNTRAERTCRDVWDVELTGRLRFQCSECGAVSLEITPRFCPNCGRKVVKR